MSIGMNAPARDAVQVLIDVMLVHVTFPEQLSCANVGGETTATPSNTTNASRVLPIVELLFLGCARVATLREPRA
jgi:hypothetical protein